MLAPLEHNARPMSIRFLLRNFLEGKKEFVEQLESPNSELCCRKNWKAKIGCFFLSAPANMNHDRLGPVDTRHEKVVCPGTCHRNQPALSFTIPAHGPSRAANCRIQVHVLSTEPRSQIPDKGAHRLPPGADRMRSGAQRRGTSHRMAETRPTHCHALRKDHSQPSGVRRGSLRAAQPIHQYPQALTQGRSSDEIFHQHYNGGP